MKAVLDHGYVCKVEAWGSDERVIESARMSTSGGFRGWGTPERPGDEKLLGYLWDHQHGTPFEMAGMTLEVKAPIFVFREWHRHRTQVFNEMSARYTPLPDEHYVPSVERILAANAPTSNRQAAGAVRREVSEEEAYKFRMELMGQYMRAQTIYQKALDLGIAKELARLPVPVARYSRMRASANLRNWLGFLKLRCDAAAQWEIRQFANAVAELVAQEFPRTYDVAKASLGLP